MKCSVYDTKVPETPVHDKSVRTFHVHTQMKSILAFLDNGSSDF